MRKSHRALSMFLAVLVFGLPQATQAATLTVSSLADDGSPGTLRSQVAAAAAGDTIDFSVTGTILLSHTGAIVINKDLIITGPGQGSLTVSGRRGLKDGHGFFSIFRIGSGLVSLSGLTLSNGDGTRVGNNNRYGGAIHLTGGTLTVTASTFSNNEAVTGGAIGVSDASLTVAGCTFSGNTAGLEGGAIYLEGSGSSLTVTDTTLSGNTAKQGGALSQGSGTSTIKNTTISGNTANFYFDGAMFNYGNGGGIYHQSGVMTLTNCTISGNHAAGQGLEGGGGIFTASVLTVANCTITLNSAEQKGGGILVRNNVVPNLDNTIVANNLSVGADIEGSVASSAYCLIGQDPKLGPLANNGGPTQTHAPLPGSPALDAGDPNFDATALPYDQRGPGFPRIKNGRICIGAFESEQQQAGSSLVVNTLDDHDDGIAGPTDCSLREAVKYAPAGATITFAVTGTITLTLGELVIAKNLTITGPAQAPGLTVSGGNASRIFRVTQSAPPSSITANLSNLTLSGGNGVGGVSGPGGAVAVDSLSPTLVLSLSVTNCTFTGNQATAGGAIRSGGILTVQGSTFTGNTSSNNGGAIQSVSASLTVTNSTFSGNSTTGSGSNGAGGAINVMSGGTLTVTSSTFSGNSATLRGGGVAIGTGTASLANTIMTGNTAPTGPDLSGTAGGGGFNLVSNPAGATLTSPSNLTGQPALLGPLANNGGPTQTHALLAGSPALNAGSNALIPGGVTTDQRGFARVDGGTVDIGAFELDATPPAVTLNQAAAQTDPTISSPVRFTVVFSEPVTGFTTGDVTLGGTAGATTAFVTGSGTTYEVAVSGMTRSGTVLATIAAGVAQDLSANANAASTSTDNSVFYYSAEQVQRGGTIQAAEGGGYAVSFLGNPGEQYTIQFASQLAPADWQTLRTQTADASGAVSFVDNPPPGTPRRFYRQLIP